MTVHRAEFFLLLSTTICITGPATNAAVVDVLSYPLPAAWDGVSPTVTDQGAAGNDAAVAGSPALSASLPPGAPAETMSLDSTGGGFQTDATGLLDNAIVAAGGGYQFSVSFLWDGADAGVMKIIDYAGTESLQLENIDGTNGTADLRFLFNDSAGGTHCAHCSQHLV